MEIPISDTVSVIILIVGIANIMLWFKIWFMTNDVKRIANRMDDLHDKNTFIDNR